MGTVRNGVFLKGNAFFRYRWPSGKFNKEQAKGYNLDRLNNKVSLRKNANVPGTVSIKRPKTSVPIIQRRNNSQVLFVK
jgi:hypothetical protein